MACPKEVVVWNYFDHEHVVGTHYKWYSGARVLMEKDDWCLVDRYYKLPLVNMKASSIGFMAMLDPNHIKSFQHGKFGLILEQDIYLKELDAERCLVSSEYRMEIPGWAVWLLDPIFKRVMAQWFLNTWVEDAPMRLRRYKVWKLGFKDFSGIDYINKKTEKPAKLKVDPYPIELPVPKSTSIVNEGFTRPFSKSVELGYNDGFDEDGRPAS